MLTLLLSVTAQSKETLIILDINYLDLLKINMLIYLSNHTKSIKQLNRKLQVLWMLWEDTCETEGR